MNENKFIPVKITDRKWAEKLLDGEVFMRPLYEFGGWNQKNRSPELKNTFRGDISEGTSTVFANVEDCPIIDDLRNSFGDRIKRISYIDDMDVKYFKIFSLYCMEYDKLSNSFVKPDSKMREFGDTAVIIADYNKFIERFGIALFQKYDCAVALMDRVKFYDSQKTKETNPLFEKRDDYLYQKELRLAFCELQKNEFSLEPNLESKMEIIEDLTPIKLQLGNLRDIAYAIHIGNFLKSLIPQCIPLHFPMRELYESQSNYDVLVTETRKKMKNYKPNSVKPLIALG